MKDKACYNIEAARLLTENSFFDSAASRAYYATYLSAWHTLDVLGISAPDDTRDGNRYWRHDAFPNRLCEEYGLIGPAQISKWQLLYQLRIKADYYPDEITQEEAKYALLTAKDFLEHFKREEESIE